METRKVGTNQNGPNILCPLNRSNWQECNAFIFSKKLTKIQYGINEVIDKKVLKPLQV